MWNTTGSSPATSNDFFAPLTFDGSGNIAQMNCSSYAAPTLALPGSAGTQNQPLGLDQASGISNFYNWCDIYGSRSRAQSFTPSAAAVGHDMRVSIEVHQQGVPNAPLVLDIRAADANGLPTGSSLSSTSVPASGTSWAPRLLTAQLNGSVVGGQRYAIVLHSSTSQGCYGVQFRDGGSGYAAGVERFSGDGGATFSSPESMILKFQTQILPSTQPAGSGIWTFDEGSGNVAADSSGHGDGAILVGTAGWTSTAQARVGNSALAMNGSGNADVSGSVIDSGQSFTVSGWVNLSSVDNNAYAAVSLDGNQQSGFYLEYCGFCNGGAFDFTMVNADQSNPAAIRATGVTHPTANTWYHLVGVYDNGSNMARLYVNGSLEATSFLAFTPWTAAGHAEIGRAKYNGSASNYWVGALDDVRFNSGVLPP